MCKKYSGSIFLERLDPVKNGRGIPRFSFVSSLKGKMLSCLMHGLAIIRAGHSQQLSTYKMHGLEIIRAGHSQQLSTYKMHGLEIIKAGHSQQLSLLCPGALHYAPYSFS